MYGEIINIKNRGGLLHPHMDTYKICKATEKELRATDTKKKDFYPRLYGKILRNVGTSFQDCCSTDHINTITQNIVQLFLKLRLHHLASRRTEDVIRSYVRHRNHKSTHQQHQ